MLHFSAVKPFAFTVDFSLDYLCFLTGKMNSYISKAGKCIGEFGWEVLAENMITLSFRLCISFSGMLSPSLKSFKTASSLLSVKRMQSRGFTVALCCLHLRSGGVSLSSGEPDSGPPCPILML